MPGSLLGGLRPSLLQTPGLEERHLCSPAGPESWVWQRGTGTSSPAPQHSTSLGIPRISLPFSQLGVRANQPGSCSAMPGALGQCYCEFGHTHWQTPNPMGLAAPMPETPPVPRPCLAPSAAPWDKWLGKVPDPSVSPRHLFAYKTSHPHPLQLQPGDMATQVWGEEHSTTPAVPLSGWRTQASGSIPPSPLSPPRPAALSIRKGHRTGWQSGLSMYTRLSAGEGNRPCDTAPGTAVAGQAAQAGTESVPLVPLWAVTITVMKHPPPSHPCPGSPALPAAQPCHPAKINHPTSHPLCINRSTQEQGLLPRKQLRAQSMPQARTGQHPEPSGSQVAGPCPHPPSTASRWAWGTSPAAGREQMGREQGSHPSPRDLSLREGTTHPDHIQALPCLEATSVATPRVLPARCCRVLGHYPPKMCHGTSWATAEVMVPGHSWAAAAWVPWVLLTPRGGQPDE